MLEPKLLLVNMDVIVEIDGRQELPLKNKND